MNFANVRSAIAVTIAFALPLIAVPAADAAQPQVTLAWLPPGTSVGQLARAGLAPGLLSAGLGSVPAQQTYLDVTQGNRVFDSLYDAELPAGLWVAVNRPVRDPAVLERARSAPAEIEPGLLGATLREAGKSFAVRDARARQLPGLVAGLRGADLLIAIERPPPPSGRALAIGVAGRGFAGNLTSDSTRMDGYVLATDLAPTILQRLGESVPAAMAGQPIEAMGEVDPAAVAARGDRLAVISERRGPVVGLSLLVWLLVLGLAVAASRGEAARTAVKLVGLAVVYLPLVLLGAAAVEPGETVETLLTMAAAPLLAALTLALLAGYRALAAAAALTVVAYALDVVAGSPLTSLSLLGPNPGLGVRFFGIGNELEALLAVLVVAGTGAGLAGFAAGRAPRAWATAFLAIGVAAAAIFAAGRFGADVGAAIVLPFGAAVAAATAAARRRRTALLVIALPFLGLALLALGDLLSGADAHLTRSVLEAGGFGEAADVAQRRLQLSARSFTRPIVAVFLPLVGILIALAVVRRERLRAWLAGAPPLRAGLIGAAAATAVGTLANDSGALFLEIGLAYLLVFVGFAWAVGKPGPGDGAE